MKILVIQLGGEAELLLSTLLIRCLKRDLPQVELHYLLHYQHAEVLATNPYIDHLHRLHFNRQTTLHELRPQAFDHVFDLQNGEASTWPAELGIQVHKEKQKDFKTFFSNLFRATNKGGHPAERFLSYADQLNITNDQRGLDFFIPKEVQVPYNDIPSSHHAGYLVIAISADSNHAWPSSMLEQLCRTIAHPIILIGTKGDAPIAEKVRQADNIKIYNACGKFSKYETADLVRKAKLLLLFQPYYIQLGAALSKEMVWLHIKGIGPTEPYYSSFYLKSISYAPYDSVTVSSALFTMGNKVAGKMVEEENDKALKLLLDKVKQRLQPKA